MTVPIKDDQSSGRVSNEKLDCASDSGAPEEPVTDSVTDQKVPPAERDDAAVYPSTIKLVLIMIALCLSIFLVALDQTIIAPALGAITGDFRSVKDIVSKQTPYRESFSSRCRKFMSMLTKPFSI